ncbi:MAG TPA: hypothetical protein VIT67_15015 [Povalibacter sp.]
MKTFLIVASFCLAGAAASAQSLEEVVVTGMRASDYSEMPAITITKPADFLVQEIQLINDSRSPDLRKKEIISTIQGMLKRAASDKGIALSYGEGFLVPVNLTDESLQIIEDKKRPDTSRVEIFVKVTLSAGDDTKAKIAGLRKFIEKTQLVGRTEIDPLGDVGLSIVGPEKYRYDILARIAEENARLTKAVGSKCEVKVSGLSGRVRWERTEVAELMLYIPYDVEISHCTYAN